MRNLWILAIIVLASCKKELSATPEPTPEITLEQALTGRPWMITSIVLTTSDGGLVNIFAVNFKDCERDDLLNFGKDGVFTKTDGGIICNPPGNSVFRDLNGGFWNSSPDSSLTINKGFNNQRYKVTNWTNTSMKWVQTQTSYSGVRETYTYQLASK
jgi:hypothetical protein